MRTNVAGKLCSKSRIQGTGEKRPYMAQEYSCWSKGIGTGSFDRVARRRASGRAKIAYVLDKERPVLESSLSPKDCYSLPEMRLQQPAELQIGDEYRFPRA